MDLRPDVLATEVAIESLASTARSIATQAADLGYRVTAARALGPRLPKVVGQDVVRQSLTIVTGVRGEFGFKARYGSVDGWDVRIRRPGWPDLESSVAGLRLLLKAQGTKADA